MHLRAGQSTHTTQREPVEDMHLILNHLLMNVVARVLEISQLA